MFTSSNLSQRFPRLCDGFSISKMLPLTKQAADVLDDRFTKRFFHYTRLDGAQGKGVQSRLLPKRAAAKPESRPVVFLKWLVKKAAVVEAAAPSAPHQLLPKRECRAK